MNFLRRIQVARCLKTVQSCRFFASDPMKDRETSIEKSHFNKEEGNNML